MSHSASSEMKLALTANDVWVKELTHTLFYPAVQVGEHPLGLAAYRDKSHRLPLLLISQDRPVDQTLGAARSAGFEFLVIGDLGASQIYRVGAYEGDEREVGQLPTWMPAHPRKSLVSKEICLLPFRDEEAIRRAFTACHNAIYKELANDPAASFDLLSVVIAARILDERSDKQVYEFALIAGEDPSASKARLLRLLSQGHDWLDGHTEKLKRFSPPDFSDSLAVLLLRQFQDYSFSVTANSASGTDILGTAYEAMVGSTFRGELGSYFTPRTIGDFMVRLLNPTGLVLDPACGTAGLLISAQGYKGDAVSCHGNDLNPRMVHTARVNFLLHDMDAQNVLRGDGLELDRMYTTWFDAEVVPQPFWWSGPNGKFDAVLANPPFAGHERDSLKLSAIETAHRADGLTRSLNRTIPFLEVIVAALKPGGVAGVVIPTSILNAEEESFVRFRSLLLEHTEILAIIGLPEKAFVHTDCGVHGALLFFRRVLEPRSDYDIFVDWAENLGYDRLGRWARENDFPLILQKYAQETWPSSNAVKVSQLKEWGRFDPAWIRIASTLPAASNNDDYVRLTEVVEVVDRKFIRRSIDDDAEYQLFEVSDANVLTGEIERVHRISGFELRKKGRIKNRVAVGDVLFPNHRDSLIAKSAPNGRSAVLVGEEHDGVLTTDRFMVLRSKVDPRLARLILNSKGVRRQIVGRSRGAASLDIREATLADVLVPRALVEGEVSESVLEQYLESETIRLRLAGSHEALGHLIESQFGGTSTG